MSRLDWRIARRYLRSRRSSRLVSLITLIGAGGVTVGVAALIIVLGVMNGLQNELRERILVASSHVRVLTYGAGLRLEDWPKVREQVLTHPEVVAAAPFVLTQVLFSAGADYGEGGYVLGLETDTGTAAVTSLAEHFTFGDLSFETDAADVDGGIVLGRRLADRLSAYPGDRITMVAPAGTKFNPAIGAYIPKWWTFEVTGHFETGGYEYDNAYAVVAREAAQALQGFEPEVVTGIDVRITDPWDAPRVGAELEDLLGFPYRSLDWQTQNQSIFEALKLEKLAMGTILLLIVIVAAFNIVSTLTMVVTDKTREIGILRAMGLPARAVSRVFIYQGAVIGMVGTALGSVVGIVVSRIVDAGHLIRIDPKVYFVDHLPVQVDWLETLFVAVLAVLVATAATLYPALRAAALHPVEAIRYE